MRHNTHAESEGRERNSREHGLVRHADAAARDSSHRNAECLMAAVVERESIVCCWKGHHVSNATCEPPSYGTVRPVV